MFTKLFAERGLSLDRLRALVEVGAAGSIVKAAAGDPVKQSQYSRQIKELEDFFRIELIERQGKGIRLTPRGRELGLISRFFLLGLSNFQRGCLAEGQTYRLGGGATFISQLLMPVLSQPRMIREGISYSVEVATDEEIERRLHDLTLDFGLVTDESLSRPLQQRELGQWRLELWVPRVLGNNERQVLKMLREKRLPLALATPEIPGVAQEVIQDYEPYLVCGNFIAAKAALEQQGLAALLPDFMDLGEKSPEYLAVRIPGISSHAFSCHLAWNPRLLRLNPHAGRQRDGLRESLARGFALGH
jgi:DNA-binding transcriptional LysR family regulator